MVISPIPATMLSFVAVSQAALLLGSAVRRALRIVSEIWRLRSEVEVTMVCIFLGSTEPSAFSKCSMVTCVLPSWRTYYNLPFLRTSVGFLPKGVAMECVMGIWFPVSLDA